MINLKFENNKTKLIKESEHLTMSSSLLELRLIKFARKT